MLVRLGNGPIEELLVLVRLGNGPCEQVLVVAQDRKLKSFSVAHFERDLARGAGVGEARYLRAALGSRFRGRPHPLLMLLRLRDHRAELCGNDAMEQLQLPSDKGANGLLDDNGSSTRGLHIARNNLALHVARLL